MENLQSFAKFDNSYSRLPENFYERIMPTPVSAPKLMAFNFPLAKALNLSVEKLSEPELAEVFSGNKLLPGAEPLALAYAGHQFGQFVPQLGDGRAILLGEVVDKNGKHWDMQLKGAGQTKWSRRGDGRAAVGPVIREYIVSEAMAALGVPTTRSLAMVMTGDSVYREQELPGAVLTRVASSHLRVGSFEYFAGQGDFSSLKILANYAIQKHFPEVQQESNPYQSFFKKVVTAQAKLVAKWMQLGFIHGVMNTDNTSISGETIDYGPCAFLDEYDPSKVFSSIDRHGRYSYGNQGQIAQWNLASLGKAISPLLNLDSHKTFDFLNEQVSSFIDQFNQTWSIGMAEKLGIQNFQKDDLEMIQKILNLMTKHAADFTLSFRTLSQFANSPENSDPLEIMFQHDLEFMKWLEQWKSRVDLKTKLEPELAKRMSAVNPAFIPRNHRIEQLIMDVSERNDFTKMQRLIQALSNPFTDQPEFADLMLPPKPEERVLATFCGT